MSTTSNLTALEHIGSARNAFADLEHWLYSHTSTTHKLHSMEVEQERRGREVLRLLLQAHIDSRGAGWVGDGLVVNPQGSSEEIVYRHKIGRASCRERVKMSVAARAVKKQK